MPFWPGLGADCITAVCHLQLTQSMKSPGSSRVEGVILPPANPLHDVVGSPRKHSCLYTPGP